MKYKFADGTERELTDREMKDIHDLWHISCEESWLDGMIIKDKATGKRINNEQLRNLASAIFYKIDDSDYISQCICEEENDVLRDEIKINNYEIEGE